MTAAHPLPTGRDVPIIMSAPMIRALLDGRKTMTRRTLKPPRGYETYLCKPFERVNAKDVWWQNPEFDRVGASVPLRFQPGDRLWVREGCVNWTGGQVWRARWLREADNSECRTISTRGKPGLRAAMHMPRIDSRLTLIVTTTKIDRLQEISRDDAIAEGLKLVSQEIEQFFRWPAPYDQGMWLTTPAAFRWLWRQLHGDASWDANPEVVAISFVVHPKNIDALKAAA